MNIKQLEDKYLVLKKEDLERFFSGYTKGIFTTDEEQKIIDNIPFKFVLDGIWDDRIANGKAGGNKYIVLNLEDDIDIKDLRKTIDQAILDVTFSRHEGKLKNVKVNDIAIALVNAILKAKD